MTRKKVAVLVSGRGSNLRALWEFSRRAKDCCYEVGLVAADAECPALDFAREQALETYVIDPQDRLINRDSSQKIAENSWLQGIDIIALSGFMRIVRPAFLHDWPRRVINIHPSLLPKFPGLDTHARALAAQEERHGCTVHYVDNGIDTGEVIDQKSLEVHAHDTAETLAARVLKLEHALYASCLHKICAEQFAQNIDQNQQDTQTTLTHKNAIGKHQPSALSENIHVT